mmetsp:Transcript_20987/g.30827  ORF Transcript_20987/g.30827 Transcript_20987/m.30827 type:complete len:375 (+) Transcript_20987:94-1218(+)
MALILHCLRNCISGDNSDDDDDDDDPTDCTRISRRGSSRRSFTPAYTPVNRGNMFENRGEEEDENGGIICEYRQARLEDCGGGGVSRHTANNNNNDNEDDDAITTESYMDGGGGEYDEHVGLFRTLFPYLANNVRNNNNNNNGDNITPPITTPSPTTPTISNNNTTNTLTWNTISITLTLLSTLLLYPLFTKPLLQFQYTGVQSTFLSTPIVRDVSFLQIAINLYTNTPNKLFAIPNTLLFWSHVVIFPIVALLLCWLVQMFSRNTKRVSILVGMLQCIAPFCNVAMFAMSAGVASQNMERISTFLFDENALCHYLQNHLSIMEGQECLVVHGMVLPGLLYALMQGFMVEILMRMMINEFQVKKEDGVCSGESL